MIQVPRGMPSTWRRPHLARPQPFSPDSRNCLVPPQVIATGRIPARASLAVGSVTHGAYRTGPGAVVQSCSGQIMLAPVDMSLPTLDHPGQAKAWEGLQRAAEPGPEASGGSDSLVQTFLSIPGLGARLVPSHTQLMRALHLKLAVNCAVNPGTALLGCLNDAYASDPHGRRLAHSVCSELFELYGGELLGLSSAEELTAYVLEIAAGTGKNKNSMLQVCVCWGKADKQRRGEGGREERECVCVCVCVLCVCV